MLPTESDGKLDRPGYVSCGGVTYTAKDWALNILADPPFLQVLDLQRLSIGSDVLSSKCIQAKSAVRISGSISLQADRQNVEVVVSVVQQEVRPVEDVEHIHLKLQSHLLLARNYP